MSAHLLTERSVFLPNSGHFAAVAVRIKVVFKALANRRSVRQMHSFDDRMLKDIGLVRGDVVAALDCPYDEDPSLHLRYVAAGRGKAR